jgi:hypothetical protein
LPNRLKEMAPHQTDMLLLVDKTSARYPWELLEDRWSQGSRPPAIAAGLVRQLKTPRFRTHPAHAIERSAFVVGNPDLSGWDKFGDLPGARREAQKVASLLGSQGYEAMDCIDEKADAILAGLHKRAWRILHLAGHGEHDFLLDSAGQTSTGKGEARAPVSGMVIGKDTFLTPGDVQQMRWVPELVFINCCHLGKTLGATATQGQFSLLAANLAVQFIEMGVKAVVAAGWAVDDGAAEGFSAGFYNHLLKGETFGEAVRAAREEIWIRFPDANTWGAYQCYGDPGYRLHCDGDESGQRQEGTWHAPAEAVSELRNYCEQIRMRVKEKGQDPDELQTLRDGIHERLKRVPDKVRADWLARADVAAALGFAWGETGAWAEAVDWLDKALRAQNGDCPVRAVEQCANFRVRLSAQRWQELREAGGAGVESGRFPLILGIEQAIRELDLISQRAPTAERLSLLGSACKRLAWLQNDAAPRLEALVNMANYYRQAFDLGKEQGKGADPYPFANWAIAKLIAFRLDGSQGGDWQASLVDECRQMIEVARGRNAEKPTFWDGVAEGDCELALLVAENGLTLETAGSRAARIAGLYRAAAARGASPREYASVREHMDFVLALCQGAGDGILTSALILLRDAL